MKEYITLTKEQFRNFESYVKENNYELNKNSLAYEVKWGDDDAYDVRLISEGSLSIQNILNKIEVGG